MSKGIPMRRRPGGPPKVVETPAPPTEREHVIHEDGTYSNDVTTVTQKDRLRDKLKVYDFMLFDDGVKWQVLELYDWGLAVAAYPRKTMPSMYDAVTFSWEELDEKKVRLV